MDDRKSASTVGGPPDNEVLVGEDALKERIGELGGQISDDYAGRELLLICILRGGVMFLTDLMRSITIGHAIDFMSVESYGSGTRKSTGQTRITMDLRTDIVGKDVLLVEDIVDTGYTLAHVLKILDVRSPNSLKVCCLLDKRERREVEVPIDYVGFEIPDKFVFGYGLDLDELWRNLPFVGVAKIEN